MAIKVVVKNNNYEKLSVYLKEKSKSQTLCLNLEKESSIKNHLLSKKR